jgi:hypothetical protein
MKKLVVLVLISSVLLSFGSVYARPDHQGRSNYQARGNRGNQHPGGYHHPRGYHYYGGRYWLGEAIIVGLAAGMIISTFDRQPDVVVVSGTQYYYDGTYYYRQGPNGYVVVNPPIVVAPAPIENTSITFHLLNSNGIITDVMLVKKGSGWVGPRGEYYTDMPSIDQLRSLYCR